jgi:uncharacterized membrane protein YedE/YeeE
MKDFVIGFATALLFGLGLGIAGMTLPEKVIGFLDVTGAWDPTLAFVMGGAIAIHAVAYRLIMKRTRPLDGGKFHVPTRRDIDARLIVGAAVFGIGWGLAGICPGPAVVAFAALEPHVLAFLGAMLASMIMFKFVINRSHDTREK